MQTNTKRLTLSAILAAIAAVVMFLEFTVPFMPPFLKLDLSLIPALVGGFIMGPVTAVLIQLVKDLVHVLLTQTGGVGEIADFVIGSCFVCIASLLYHRGGKTNKRAALGLVFGSIAMVIGSVIFNYFIAIPIYAKVTPMDQIISLCGKVNPLIHDSGSLVLFGILPFNIIKAIIVSLFSYFFYTKLRHILPAANAKGVPLH